MAIGDPVSAIANGNIKPYTAIKGYASSDFRVVQSTDGAASHGDVCLGISGKGERQYPGASDTYIAVSGEHLYYFGNGAKDVPARLGNTCAAFDRLKSAADGRLIPVTADIDNIVAIAKQAGAADDIIDVDVLIGQQAS